MDSQSFSSGLSERAKSVVQAVEAGDPLLARATLLRMADDTIPVARELWAAAIETPQPAPVWLIVSWVALAVSPFGVPFALWRVFGPPNGTASLLFGAIRTHQTDVTDLVWSFVVIAVITGLPVWVGMGYLLSRRRRRYVAHLRQQLSYECQQIAAQVLAESERTEAIGPLLEVANRLSFEPEEETLVSVSNALVRLFTRIREGELLHLTAKQRWCMCNLLVDRSDFTFESYSQGWGHGHAGKPERGSFYEERDVLMTVALLRGYEHVGDPQALRRIQKIVAETQHTLSLDETRWTKHNRAINEAALKCLPILRERTEELQTVASLLRSSGSPAPSMDHLLRPASSEAEGSPEQLLRASTKDASSVGDP